MAITVAFLLVGEEQVPLATAAVHYVQKAMPRANIVQMTDSVTPAVAEPLRMPWDGLHLMTYRLAHLAALPATDTLIIDTDVIVQRDISALFDEKFDVALTRRDKSIMWRGIDVGALMPYNTGVMLSRKPEFWEKCHAWCSKAQEEIQNWFGDQMAVKAVVSKPGFDVALLPCEEYNYTPGSVLEDVSDRAIVHYKGAAGRKQWMLDRWRNDRNR